MTPPTVVPALAGGALIGLSASLLLMLTGRIAGISGIVGGWLNSERRSEESWRLAFVIGLLLAGVLLLVFRPSSFDATSATNPYLVAVAGLFVGVGTSIGNGCTSGHGVCGISRLSKRSIVATCLFMLTAMVVTFVVRHVVAS
jgi:uncharacterized membrane protein YedE/YeeE